MLPRLAVGLLALVATSLVAPVSTLSDGDAAAVQLLVTTAGSSGAVPGSHDIRSARQLSDRVHLIEVADDRQDDVADLLGAAPGIVGVEPVGHMAAQRFPNDVGYDEQWAHELTGIEDAWDVTTGDADVGIAVLDSGIDASHRDLGANVSAQVDVSSGVAVARTVGTNNDTCALGHGTEVAGVIAAIGDNGRDVAGASWTASLVDVAVAGSASSCRMTDATLVAGLGWVSQRDDVDVVNVSFGRPAPACPVAVQAAIDEVVSSGKLVIAAAGNHRQRSTKVGNVPGSCRGVLSVGSVGIDGEAAAYSANDAWVELAAPGGDDDAAIITLAPGGTTTSVTGTSYAAAYVSGVAGLLLADDPGATALELRRALLGMAADIGAPGRDDATGWGLVDPTEALDALTGTLPADKPDPALPVADYGAARIAGGDRIGQAVTMSRTVFRDDDATHAVLARVDDYADALAGSSLAGGMGPVLLTNRTGPLPRAVLDELRRVLPDGATVFLLGGTAALPASLEAELTAAGLEPERLAGESREATAGAVASAVRSTREALGLPAPTVAVLATARNWPDAAVAASLGAVTGGPIIITPPGSLHAAAGEALFELRPETLYIVGGTAAIEPSTAESARRTAGVSVNDAPRLAGADRSATAIRVAAETEALIRGAAGTGPSLAVAVNVRRADGFADVLSSAPLVASMSGVFIPVEGVDPTALPNAAISYACGLGGRAIIIGGTDSVGVGPAGRLPGLLDGSDPACQR